MLESQLGLDGFMWHGKPALAGANKENKDLDDSLKEKKIKIQELKRQLELKKERNRLMQAHQSDLYQEINYMQQVHNAQKHEFELENNSKILADREKNRFTQEINALTTDLENILKRQKQQQNTISKQNEKIKDLKSTIKWQEDILFKWLHESSKTEKDKIALAKYTHQDNAAIKALNLDLQKLNEEAKNRKTALHEAATDAFVAEAELNRLYKEFKDQHKERSDIISNWEKVLQQIQKRNNEMEEFSSFMDSMREENEINKRLKEQNLMLASQISNNKDLECQILDSEQMAYGLRLSIADEEKAETNLEAEVNTLKNISHNMAFHAQSMRNEVKQVCEALELQNNKMTSIEKNKLELAEVTNEITKKKFNAEHYIKYLDCLLEKENKNFKLCEKKCTFIENSIIKNSQLLKNKIEEEKIKEADVLSFRALSRQRASAIRTCNQQRLQQDTIIYRINLCIENRETRVRVMEGELINDGEKSQLMQEKSSLQNELQLKHEDLNFMKKQIRYIQERLVISLKTLNTNRKEQTDLKDKINFLDCYITGIQKSLNTILEKKEELLVDNCLFNLQLQRYKDMLKEKNTAVVNLQKDRATLEMITRMRLNEIKNCCRMAQLEINKESEENYNTKRKLQECKDKVSKLQTRYEVILKALGISGYVEIHTEV